MLSYAALDKKIKALGYTRTSREVAPEEVARKTPVREGASEKVAHKPPVGQMAVSYVNEAIIGPEKNVQIVMPRRTAYITTETKDVGELLSTLDFTVTRAAIISEDTALVDVHFEQDEQATTLRLRHIVCPISSVRRISKYVAKGYSCNMIEIVKLFAEWSDRARKDGDATKGEVTPADLLKELAGELLPSGMPRNRSIALQGLYID
jgi:hypothetical protein